MNLASGYQKSGQAIETREGVEAVKEAIKTLQS
jgi:hypothetical protein